MRMVRCLGTALLAAVLALPAGARAQVNAEFRADAGELRAINSATVTATGRFVGDPFDRQVQGPASIAGGESNAFSVSAQGAIVSATPQAWGFGVPGTPDSGSATAVVSINSISATAENSGSVSADGTFSSIRITGGRRNNVSVQAVGASVTIGASAATSR